MAFFSFFLGGRFIMVYHDFHLLHLTVELKVLHALFVATGAGLFFCVWPMYGVLVGVFL